MDPRRKRLLYRCQHCGMKENDILLGRFAGAHIGGLSEQQMDQLEALLQQGDHDLYNWITVISCTIIIRRMFAHNRWWYRCHI